MALPKVAPFLALALGISAASPVPTFAFEKELHGRYTKAAFALYQQHCQPALPPETIESALIGVETGVMAEDEPTLKRAVNWHFYNRDGKVGRIAGVERSLDSVFQKRIGKLEKRLTARKAPSTIYKAVGRVLHYIQDMSVPAHAVPIYHGPGVKDLVDSYPPKGGEALQEFVQNELGRDLAERGCERLRPGNPEASSTDFFRNLLDTAAQTTLRAIGQTNQPDAGTERWLKFWGSARNWTGFASYGSCSFETPVNLETCGVKDEELDSFYQEVYRRTLEDTVRVLLYLEGRVSKNQ